MENSDGYLKFMGTITDCSHVVQSALINVHVL